MAQKFPPLLIAPQVLPDSLGIRGQIDPAGPCKCAVLEKDPREHFWVAKRVKSRKARTVETQLGGCYPRAVWRFTP
jgi:hypothetical protein